LPAPHFCVFVSGFAVVGSAEGETKEEGGNQESYSIIIIVASTLPHTGTRYQY
jgi:hypothetical protein